MIRHGQTSLNIKANSENLLHAQKHSSASKERQYKHIHMCTTKEGINIFKIHATLVDVT